MLKNTQATPSYVRVRLREYKPTVRNTGHAHSQHPPIVAISVR